MFRKSLLNKVDSDYWNSKVRDVINRNKSKLIMFLVYFLTPSNDIIRWRLIVYPKNSED